MGVKHTEFWTTAVTKLMSGLHDILDELYGPVETGLCFRHSHCVTLLFTISILIHLVSALTCVLWHCAATEYCLYGNTNERNLSHLSVCCMELLCCMWLDQFGRNCCQCRLSPVNF